MEVLLKVSQAARVLGVAPATLRSWEAKGLLMPIRHPMNGYRLYRKSDLIALLKQIHNQHLPCDQEDKSV